MATIGSQIIQNKAFFKVWAPFKEQMLLHLLQPEERKLPMQKDEEGYFTVEVEGLQAGTSYYFMPDGQHDYPDPASQFQPKGVHGPSEIVAHDAYTWNDHSWKGKSLQDMILYELHVGTFTPEGTFEAIIDRLDDLLYVGINAIELMPIAQFPGARNWGYDGVYPYAVHNSYGGPLGLKKLVDACHAKGIAVFLDVVYNHLGPEGNYFGQFGPYFTHKYETPWGEAINLEEAYSDPVRDYFADNCLFWFEQYHIDGLRLDAIHMLYDNGAVSFWELVYQKVQALQQRLGRTLHMTAESDYNSPRVMKLPEQGGLGFHAQWLDDFQHALYVLLDPKGWDRYKDFGKMEQLAKAYKEGFVHSGEYVTSRNKKYGSSSAGVSGDKFIAFNQNHDQIGNRAHGERFSILMHFKQLKIAAAALMLSPYIPLLFMGEEYAEEAPFLYFINHSDQELVKAVQQGRQQAFQQMPWEDTPLDPQDPNTYEKSKLQWGKRQEHKHKILLEWHKTLIALRQTEACLKNFNKNDISASVLLEKGLMLHRKTDGGQQHLLALFNFSEETIELPMLSWANQWANILDSNEAKWQETPDEALNPAAKTLSQSDRAILAPHTVLVYKGYNHEGDVPT